MLFLCLARKSCNQGSTDCDIWGCFPQLFNHRFDACTICAPAHPLQDCILAVLHRHINIMQKLRLLLEAVDQFVIDFPRSFRFIHSDDEGFTICRQYDKFRCLCVGIQRVRAEFVITERTQGKPRRAEAVRPHAGIQIAAIFDRIDFGIREAQIRPPGRVNCQRRIAAACLHAAGKQQQRRTQQRHADKDGSHSGRYFVEVR